jgi:hypothetical protein
MPPVPPPLPADVAVETETRSRFHINSGTWVTLGVVFLGIFASIAAWIHRHNLERQPLDFWGFDSHRVMRDAPSVRATLLKPDTTRLTGPPKGDDIWHDNLFMIIENRYLVEKQVEVQQRPEFVRIEGEDGFDPAVSLRRALRENRSYNWEAFPWSQEPQWRYALTFAKEETTYPGTKHELTRTFTFTLVFDVTCRWVTLQSVEKLTALEPPVQQRFKKFFLEVFPDSDQPPPPEVAVTPTATPTATPTGTGAPLAAGGPTPTAVPTGTAPGLSIGAGTMLSPQAPETTLSTGSMTTPPGPAGAAPPSVFLTPSKLLEQATQPQPPSTLGPDGPIKLPTLPRTTPTSKK